MIVLSLYRGLIDNTPTMKMIATEVAARHDMDLADLRVLNMSPDYTHPRQEAMAAIYATGRFSNMQIARFFGLKDHTTVNHARNAVERRAAA